MLDQLDKKDYIIYMNILELKDKSGNNVIDTLIKMAEDKHPTTYILSGHDSHKSNVTCENDKIILWYGYMLDNGSPSSGAAIYKISEDDYLI